MRQRANSNAARHVATKTIHSRGDAVSHNRDAVWINRDAARHVVTKTTHSRGDAVSHNRDAMWDNRDAPRRYKDHPRRAHGGVGRGNLRENREDPAPTVGHMRGCSAIPSRYPRRV